MDNLLPEAIREPERFRILPNSQSVSFAVNGSRGVASVYLNKKSLLLFDMEDDEDEENNEEEQQNGVEVEQPTEHTNDE